MEWPSPSAPFALFFAMGRASSAPLPATSRNAHSGARSSIPPSRSLAKRRIPAFLGAGMIRARNFCPAASTRAAPNDLRPDSRRSGDAPDPAADADTRDAWSSGPRPRGNYLAAITGLVPPPISRGAAREGDAGVSPRGRDFRAHPSGPPPKHREPAASGARAPAPRNAPDRRAARRVRRRPSPKGPIASPASATRVADLERSWFGTRLAFRSPDPHSFSATSSSRSVLFEAARRPAPRSGADLVDPRCSFLGAGPRRPKLPRDAKIYIDEYSDPSGGAERP